MNDRPTDFRPSAASRNPEFPGEAAMVGRKPGKIPAFSKHRRTNHHSRKKRPEKARRPSWSFEWLPKPYKLKNFPDTVGIGNIGGGHGVAGPMKKVREAPWFERSHPGETAAATGRRIEGKERGMDQHDANQDISRMRADSAAPARSSKPDPAAEPKRAKPPEPTCSEQAVDRLADRVLENPPQDIAVLAASVQKFLLTNLDPAMQIAEQIRRDVSETSAAYAISVVADDRQDEALTLLVG